MQFSVVDVASVFFICKSLSERIFKFSRIVIYMLKHPAKKKHTNELAPKITLEGLRWV